MESSIVMDVRFLPNPFFVSELKPYSGLDEAVRDYIMKMPETAEFLANFLPLLDRLVPSYQREGKAYLTISIGCTGGRHRSVALAESIARHLQTYIPTVRITHRDLEKGQQ
jgi:RNase adapter protein RapZ